MLEGIVLLAFIAALAGCVFTGASVLWALAGGYLIFCVYGLIRKHSFAELGKMSLSGVKTVRNILMIFGLIGFITALWRASGTIAVIVCWSSKLVSPSAFLVIAFLLILYGVDPDRNLLWNRCDDGCYLYGDGTCDGA